ncbi:NAD(P)/FAD-dependent oxidoreductase [Geminocystis sp. GBBB08]|uniref:NAD(P)/FAD-dependent oxidoreductase n=1 Tax=Geminocystis sp. GBBB08 TaxID=2604140 RepID=UPI0027E36F18|nr:NAD(P)/FAD-dependent oxidoreductase [Geminocystis sp. GBBB08]MBL1209289.1 NAD(P)/FAD-dependent oxidoreductase [Geminocystis sp. GBBB08]
MNINNPQFEVGIIGGGPAGSTLASYLSQANISCVVFEREIFPRPHVGESLVPATNRVFKELNFLETMEQAGFPHKYGAAWTAYNNKIYSHNFEGMPPDYAVDIRFDEQKTSESISNYTYHVDRGKFDQMLLEHAEKLGATVYQGVRVTNIQFSENENPKIFTSQDDKTRETSVRLVVDASGRRTILGSQLNLKIKDPVFNQFAIHTWFEGFDRGETEQKDYTFIHFLPISNSWIWQIPISETVTSFGVVTQKEHFSKKKQEREEFFWDCVKTQPKIYDKLKQAKQLRAFKEESDYSYGMKQFCGDGWILVGDAARFVDPIFSSGVSVALNSARFASHDIIRAFQEGNLDQGKFRRKHFEQYESILKRGTKNWYEFISLYYRLNVLFTRFVFDPRHRLDVIKLLSGDVYDQDEPSVLQEMRKIVTEIEQNPNHLLHKLLGNLTANAFNPS